MTNSRHITEPLGMHLLPQPKEDDDMQATETKHDAKKIAFDMEDDIRTAHCCAWLLYERLSKSRAIGNGIETDAYCMIAGDLLHAVQKTVDAWSELFEATRNDRPMA